MHPHDFQPYKSARQPISLVNIANTWELLTLLKFEKLWLLLIDNWDSGRVDHVLLAINTPSSMPTSGNKVSTFTMAWTLMEACELKNIPKSGKSQKF